MLTHEEIQKAVTFTASQFPIKQASYFGSYAEGRQTESSDLDLLLEFQSPSISLLTLSAIKNTLEDLLKVSVDVIHTPLEDSSLFQVDKSVRVYG